MAIRAGIVGCGDAGKSFASAAQHVDDVELVGMAGLTVEEAAPVAERMGTRAMTFDDLLALGPDVVAIATPPGVHAAQALRCLEAGAHVMIEKPMALALEDCDRLIDEAAARDRRVMVTQTWRYRPDVHMIVDRARSGAYGDLFALTITRTCAYFGPKRVGWQLDPALSGGGVGMNMFIHSVDLVRFIGGAEVADFHGSVGCHQPGVGVDSDLLWSARLENGVAGSILIDGLGHEDRFILEAHCTGGTIIAHPRQLTIDVFVEGEVAEHIDTGDSGTRAPNGVWAHHGYINEWREMVDAVERGGPIRSDGPNGRENVRLARALMEGNGIVMPGPTL